MNKEISTRLIYQYRTLEHDGFANVLFTYLLVPGTVFHLGYDVSFEKQGSSMDWTKEIIYTKISYLFRLQQLPLLACPKHLRVNRQGRIYLCVGGIWFKMFKCVADNHSTVTNKIPLRVILKISFFLIKQFSRENSQRGAFSPDIVVG